MLWGQRKWEIFQNHQCNKSPMWHTSARFYSKKCNLRDISLIYKYLHKKFQQEEMQLLSAFSSFLSRPSVGESGTLYYGCPLVQGPVKNGEHQVWNNTLKSQILYVLHVQLLIFCFGKEKKNQHEIVLVEQFNFAWVHNCALYPSLNQLDSWWTGLFSLQFWPLLTTVVCLPPTRHLFHSFFYESCFT